MIVHLDVMTFYLADESRPADIDVNSDPFKASVEEAILDGIELVKEDAMRDVVVTYLSWVLAVVRPENGQGRVTRFPWTARF